MAKKRGPTRQISFFRQNQAMQSPTDSIYPEYLTDMNIWACPSDNDDPQGWLSQPHPLLTATSVPAQFQWAKDQAANMPPFMVPADTNFVNSPNNKIGLTATSWVASGNGLSYMYYPFIIQGDWLFNATNNQEIMRLWCRATRNDAAGNAQNTRYANRNNDKTVTLWPGVGDMNQVVPGTPSAAAGGPTVQLNRLREGSERFTITDINNPAASAKAQSDIVVMTDFAKVTKGVPARTHFNHLPGGSNILFMDGHVEYGRFGTTDWGGRLWPVSRGFVKYGNT